MSSSADPVERYWARQAAEQAARERVLELPQFTLFRAGWRTDSGHVQGQIYYRIGQGLGPTSRDRCPDDVLSYVCQSVHMPHAHQQWDIEILATPL